MPPHRYTSGVRVVEHPDKGQLLVATRAFAAGEMVLVEPPLITFRSPKQAVQAFLRLNEEKRAQYLSTRHIDFSVAPPRHRQCLEFSTEYLRSAAGIMRKLQGVLTVEKVCEVISVTQFNCFTFDAAGQMYSESLGPEPNPLAAYYLGGKIMHSCDPNTIYTSSVFPGSGAFAALRAIEEGEVITTALVDSLDGLIVRRGALLSQRDYFCDCPRCLLPDISGGIACEQPGCTGTKFGFHRNPDDTTLRDFECSKCGDTTMPDLSLEKHFSDLVTALSMELQMSPNMRVTISKLDDVLAEMQTRLCRTHHLVVRLLKMQARAYCSFAILLESNEDKKGSTHHRFKSSMTGACAVKVMECIAAQCPNGLGCPINHPPRVGKPETILWVCMDLLKCSPSTRRSLYPLVEKYIPFMRSVYGDDDDDLCNIIDMLRRAGRHVVESEGEQKDAQEAQEMLEQLLLQEEQEKQARKQKQGGKKRRGAKK